MCLLSEVMQSLDIDVDEETLEEAERELEWLQHGSSARTLNPVSRDWIEDGYNLDDD